MAVTVVYLVTVQAAGVFLFSKQEQALLIRAGFGLSFWTRRGRVLALAGAQVGAATRLTGPEAGRGQFTSEKVNGLPAAGAITSAAWGKLVYVYGLANMILERNCNEFEEDGSDNLRFPP